jgi:hypothetical protein
MDPEEDLPFRHNAKTGDTIAEIGEEHDIHQSQ